MNTDIILQRCLQKAETVLPRPYPTTYDRQDQLSDFAYGLLLGLKKVKREWTEEQCIKFAINNAVFYVRAKQFKAMKKRVMIFCKNGHKIPRTFNGIGSIRPCCGTVQELVFVPFIICLGTIEVWRTRSTIQREDCDVDY